jgi:hypothetical protein
LPVIAYRIVGVFVCRFRAAASATRYHVESNYRVLERG